MKEWLKEFSKGTYVACWMIIVVGVAFIVVRLGVWLLIIGAAIGSRIEPTANNIIIMLCVFFVFIFGLI